MTQSGLRTVVEDRRANAVIGWTVLAFLAASGGSELLFGQQVWGALVLALVAVALVPPVAFRNATAMLPWEVLALASLPAVGRTLIVGETVGGITFTGRVTTYLAVATVALIVAVELDVFTPVRMTHSFAVFFVTIATMAAAGVWAVVRYFSDTFLGTRHMLDGRPEHAIETALMWDFVAATVAGVLAGLLFEYYFRRRAAGTDRIDVEVTEA
ncbi:hypothetical protein [Halobaculum magnesiiphilum]|uniref:Uncharacterized protein n=1 Tax=Halobaculum magnesiiphilum TaxID=1017351 RepID=A0A8T8WDA3_9EURY|nr:hypothetical protein [Halobaculum magnesiiphilum]QZP37815.1 hypothetical protein K6T50_01135 [Halobaculum magnesiiphilum]